MFMSNIDVKHFATFSNRMRNHLWDFYRSASITIFPWQNIATIRPKCMNKAANRISYPFRNEANACTGALTSHGSEMK